MQTRTAALRFREAAIDKWILAKHDTQSIQAGHKSSEATTSLQVKINIRTGSEGNATQSINLEANHAKVLSKCKRVD